MIDCFADLNSSKFDLNTFLIMLFDAFRLCAICCSSVHHLYIFLKIILSPLPFPSCLPLHSHFHFPPLMMTLPLKMTPLSSFPSSIGWNKVQRVSKQGIRNRNGVNRSNSW